LKEETKRLKDEEEKRMKETEAKEEALTNLYEEQLARRKDQERLKIVEVEKLALTKRETERREAEELAQRLENLNLNLLRCATNDDLQTAPKNTLYYLRYLSKEEFDRLKKHRAFSTLSDKTGHYIGCKESDWSCKHLSIGERSTFQIEYDRNSESFRVYLSKKNQQGIDIRRILSWSQSVGTGYYMYKCGNQDWDGSNKYTRFIYNDADYSLSAKPSDGQIYPLGEYKYEGYTAIYRVYNGGKENTKFCFQKVNQ
jgi:hypothetical protein